MSHAAVKDSCHPVSGSNTHTHRVNEENGFESRRDGVVSGKPPPPPLLSFFISRFTTGTKRRETNIKHILKKKLDE